MEKESQEVTDARKKMLGKIDVADRYHSIERESENFLMGNATKARKAKEAFSLEGLLAENIVPAGMTPLTDKAAYDALTLQDKVAYVDAAFKMREGPAISDAVTTFRKYADSMLKDAEGKYVKGIEAIALDKEFVKHVGEKDVEFVNHYAASVRAKETLKLIEEKKEAQIPAEMKEQLIGHIAAGAAREAFEKMYKEGRRTEDCRLAGNFAAVDAQRSPKALELGAKEMQRKADEALKKFLKEDKVEDRLGKYVTNTLKSMIDTQDQKIQFSAMDYVNRIYTGKHIGERDVKEFGEYKKFYE